jgi:hypothetical protein
MTKELYILTLCESVKKQNQAWINRFHFKGAYKGKPVNSIISITRSEIYSVGSEYIIKALEDDYIAGDLYVKTIRYREIF